MRSGKTIVFLDVDCIAKADVAPLAAVPGDVAFKVKVRRRPSGSIKVSVVSTVLTIKPTASARRFVETWGRLSREPHWGDVDQTTLALAMGADCGCSFAHLDDALVYSVIRHAAVSNSTARKIGGARRELANLWRWAYPLG